MKNPTTQESASLAPEADSAPRKKRATARSAESRLTNGPVNYLLDQSVRPLCGIDIERFRAGLDLNRAEFAMAMAIPQPQYLKMVSNPLPLELSQEILLRLYELKPYPAPWTRPTPGDMFEAFYGDLARSFSMNADQDAARVMLYHRFTAALGRTSARAYHWIENRGGYTNTISLILGKSNQFEDPREALESVARITYRVRQGCRALGTLRRNFV